MDSVAGKHRRARGADHALRLLASDPFPPVPSVDELLGEAVRRPGQFHEVVVLSRQDAHLLARAAADCWLHTDVLGSLLLEAALVAADISMELFTALRPSLSPAPHPSMSAAEAAYLRTLTLGRRARPARRAPAPDTIAVPARIVTRLATVELSRALSAVPCATAIAWETVALREGRTLGECVLLRATQAASNGSPRQAASSAPASAIPSKSAR